MKRIPKYTGLNKNNKVIKVNRNELCAASLNSYFVPEYYEDKTCVCRQCNKRFIFTSEQQRRLYENHKRHISVSRVMCSKCKDELREIECAIQFLEIKIGPKQKEGTACIENVAEIIRLLDKRYKYTQKRDVAKNNRYIKLYESLTSR